jgi:hypothetical protein
MVPNEFTILAGTANRPLAAAIAAELGTQVGDCVIDRFPDGEVMVQLREPVRRKEVFLVQPTSPPVNDHLVELLAMADACRRAAAASITAIVPYFGYGRADKRHGRREAITGRVVADLLQVVGISHVVTVDLHTPQIEGFFYAPVDTLAPRMGMTAEIPPMDPYPLRTMTDMGMGGMNGMNMSGMASHQMPGTKDMQMKGMSDKGTPGATLATISSIKPSSIPALRAAAMSASVHVAHNSLGHQKAGS